MNKKLSQKSIIFCIRSGLSRYLLPHQYYLSMHLRLWANDTARQNGIPQVATGTNKSNSDAAMNSTQQINSNKP
ncbi:MAG: hypothetical protein M3Y53_11115 [Thermoproteota archaeon]|nr:hypothetical protein [Thermoproteota archaeon]